MELKISAKGGRTLIARKDELKCFFCGEKKPKAWYYCEERHKVMCEFCARRSGTYHRDKVKFCCGTSYHSDYFIDNVQLIEGGKKK